MSGKPVIQMSFREWCVVVAISLGCWVIFAAIVYLIYELTKLVT